MNMTSTGRRFDQCALGLFFASVGATCLVAIKFHSSRSLTNPNDPGPWLMPTLLGSLLLIGGIAFVIVNLAKPRPAPATGIGTETTFNWKPWAMLGGIILYVGLLPWLGFLVATPVFVFLMLWRMNIVWWKAIIAACVLTAVGQLVFVWGFRTPLPTAFWN